MELGGWATTKSARRALRRVGSSSSAQATHWWVVGKTRVESSHLQSASDSASYEWACTGPCEDHHESLWAEPTVHYAETPSSNVWAYEVSSGHPPTPRSCAYTHTNWQNIFVVLQIEIHFLPRIFGLRKLLFSELHSDRSTRLRFRFNFLSDGVLLQRQSCKKKMEPSLYKMVTFHANTFLGILLGFCIACVQQRPTSINT